MLQVDDGCHRRDGVWARRMGQIGAQREHEPRHELIQGDSGECVLWVVAWQDATLIILTSTGICVQDA